jgi:alkylation response protein AidB-like acyl-CoA dehydrogenase
MNFDYNEEQQLLADSVRRYLADKYQFEQRQKVVRGEGWSAEAWAQFAQLGLAGLPVSAEHGGFGGGAVDLMGVMEAFGEALVVEPYLSHVMATRAVERGGATDLLPAVIDGSIKLAWAHTGTGVTAKKSGARWTLEGEKPGVIGAPVAERLVVSARVGDALQLFLVERPEVRSHRTMDERLAGDVVFRHAEARPLEGARVEDLVDFGTALVCAEGVGVMKFACDTTLEYLKTRKQFGVPIGTFQALQHRMVDMFISLEQARSMACLACSRADAGGDPKSISAAKIKIADAARHISQESVQLHGGMGMSEELKVSHAFRRLTVLAREFGDADYHLARFARL